MDRDMIERIVRRVVEEVSKADVKIVSRLVSPGMVYAIYGDWDEEDGVIRVVTNRGIMEFYSYNGKYEIVEPSDRFGRYLRLEDGTIINMEFVEDIATIFSVLYGTSRKMTMKDMFACMYTAGKNKPVGFSYRGYFAIIAPMVEYDLVED